MLQGEGRLGMKKLGTAQLGSWAGVLRLLWAMGWKLLRQFLTGSSRLALKFASTTRWR